MLCWGDNSSGQLVVNAGDYSKLPLSLPATYGPFVDIDAGAAHICALTGTDSLWCWGDNSHGQLGTGSISASSPPVQVTGLGGPVSRFSTGAYHTCAIVNSTVKCWGEGSDGQLGQGQYADRASPVSVVDLSDAKAVSAGETHTCALTTGGAAKCWGSNNTGQLGTDDHVSANTARGVVGMTTDVTVIAAGSGYTCAKHGGDSVQCWGSNIYGKLGDGTNDFSATPVAVRISGADVVDIRAGIDHTCALLQNGDVKCWGYNSYGQLGDNTITDSPLPVDIVNVTTRLSAVRVGEASTCALTYAGGVLCWGDNSYGQLADGTTAERHIASDVLTRQQCYKLMFAYSGNGTMPAAKPDQSEGCAADHYFAGMNITVFAQADPQWRVNGWSGTAEDKSLSSVNRLLMPAADHTAAVAYAQCHRLTVTYAGDGASPVALPANSAQCEPGRYVAGELVSFFAKPEADQRVQSWSGTDTVPDAGMPVNTLRMPESDRTVRATYETCYTLSLTVSSGGGLLLATPAASMGCAAGFYSTGQAVQLHAEPESDWTVIGWQGTEDDASCAAENTITMPANDHKVGVIYARDAQNGAVYLPAMLGDSIESN